MSIEPHQADLPPEAAPPDTFHTDKMILFSGVVGVMATVGFIAIVILNFVTD